MKIARPGGNLGVRRGAYPQSYPQILWVSPFVFSARYLSAFGKVISKILRQASEPA